jgi:hypothetical protein
MEFQDFQALELVDITDGELVAVATTNLPNVHLEEGEVIIKDYSENEGMLDFLLNNHIVERTGKKVNSGFVTMEICKLC